jgi:hypothetical protein
MRQNQKSNQNLSYLGQQNYSLPEETLLDPSSAPRWVVEQEHLV